MKILIVEDDLQLANALMHIVTEHKYMAEVVNNGRDAVDFAVSGQYDVMILDVMLPKLNGYEVATAIRAAKNSIPILMLTAKDTTPDKVEGLNSGADDYMTKPFSTEELLARINALTRRQGDVVMDELNFQDVKLNVHTGELSCSSHNISLSFKELEIMKILLSNPEMFITKEVLLIHVWGSETDVDENNVEVYISFLRKKLKFIESCITIKNKKRLGYRLEKVEC